MDSKEQPAPSARCETLSTTAPEAQWNLQMYMPPTLKEETVESIDEELSPCREDMYPYNLVELKYVNYYDSKDFVSEVKNEYPEDECFQLNSSMNSKIDSDSMELSTLINEQKVKIENTDEELSLIIKDENKDKPVIINTERLKKQGLLVIAPSITSIHYDVLVTPQEVQCKLCDRIFKNSYNLLKHNIEHIKININTSGDKNKLRECHSKKNEVYKCKFCEVVYSSKTSFTEHMRRLHYVYGRMFKCWCGKEFRTPVHLYQHKSRLHDSKFQNRQFKCDSCQKIVSTKRYLAKHVNNMHGDYAKFKCWCGKRYRTLKYLTEHKTLQHSSNEGNELYKCKYCDEVCFLESNLKIHMKNVHNNYGRTYDCWCGKQFLSPTHLDEHRRQQQHTTTGRFQCGSCHKFFNYQHSLTLHIKKVHVDYGRVFECRCERQFRSPLQLKRHWNDKHALTDGSYSLNFKD